MSIITDQSMLATMSLHRDQAAGIIRPAEDQARPGSFSDLMKQKVVGVNADQNLATARTAAVETGESDDLVGAMVASQKASLSFSAMVQVRNRLVAALDEIMKMPM
ncbi:flagellar hook-basal body complex protein FliE [Ferrimonas sediminicola]|uniref:Flagellar hook-basal body complex protein FliE n=1 Tax=Ferrimonas sediminicola TaxID=2569538 RepID=A0A4U1BC86_9GAMM|nr:flagellar hook-basal body complex protein FliE [Ferrimonas sediminicola]TKB47784.1 flagellar hook-basal body complex protein FliE [Ferrimonas sediminicola]